MKLRAEIDREVASHNLRSSRTRRPSGRTEIVAVRSQCMTFLIGTNGPWVNQEKQ